VANDDSFYMPPNTTLIWTHCPPGMVCVAVVRPVDVLLNDYDPDGDLLTAHLIDGPSHGQLTLAPNGSFVYTPVCGFAGTDSFTYRANDGSLDSNLATVTITVTDAIPGSTRDDCLVTNIPPVARDDAYDVQQNTELADMAPGVLSNDIDIDRDTLTAELASRVSYGTLEFHPDGTFRYRPDPAFCGSDSFTYRASDGEAHSNVATVSLTVSCANRAPVANDDGFQMTANTTLTVTFCQPGAVCIPEARIGVLLNDYDPDGDSLTARPVSTPSHGKLSLALTGGFVYVPDCGFTGTDSFTYRANDGSLDSNLATVTIRVTPGITGFTFRDGCLSITGTEGSDTIRLVRVRKALEVRSNLGTFPIQTLKRVVVHALGGDDTVELSTLQPGQTGDVDGGEGNDRITGGSGRDILFGGPGDDYLVGGKGDNVVIGGTGSDQLVGSKGIDLLIADVLDDRAGPLEVGSLLDSWRAANSPTAKQAVAQQLIDHVVADAALDLLTGGRGADLFVVRLMDIVSDGRLDDLLVHV
jgi:hypothetical protein